MDSNEIFSMIEDIEFFKGFTEADRKEVSKIDASMMQFQTGDSLIRQGDVDQSLFILLKGQAVVTRNENPKYEIRRLEKGAIFGEMSYILNLPRTCNVIVKSDYAIALKMDGKLFEALDPLVVNKFKDRFLVILAERLEVADLQMAI